MEQSFAPLCGYNCSYQHKSGLALADHILAKAKGGSSLGALGKEGMHRAPEPAEALQVIWPGPSFYREGPWRQGEGSDQPKIPLERVGRAETRTQAFAFLVCKHVVSSTINRKSE